MKKQNICLTALSLYCLLGSAHAMTADEMMSQAYRQGRASGELTGLIADQVKSATHSLAATRGLAERVSIGNDGCYTVRFTVTQPDVPDVRGGVVGDYVTVTKFVTCPDNREQAEPQIIECRIGAVSCLPPGAKTAPQSPAQK